MGRWGTWGTCGCCTTGTTIAGKVNGCGSKGVAATVEVKSGSTSYGVVNTDAGGNFSGTVPVPSSGSYSITFKILSTDPYAARFVATTSTWTLTAGGTNNLGTVTLSVDTVNYVCTSMAYFPLKRVLKVSDTYDGLAAGTANYTGTRWTCNFGPAYPGCAAHGCTTQLTSPKQYSLTNAGVVVTAFNSPSGSNTVCPAGSGIVTTDTVVTAAINSLDPFNATATLATGNTSWWYCGNSTTWTWTE